MTTPSIVVIAVSAAFLLLGAYVWMRWQGQRPMLPWSVVVVLFVGALGLSVLAASWSWPNAWVAGLVGVGIVVVVVSVGTWLARRGTHRR